MRKPPRILTRKERAALESLARDYIRRDRSDNEIFLDLHRKLSIDDIRHIRAAMIAAKPKPSMASIREVK